MILLKNKDKKANIKIGNNIEIKDGSDFPFDLTLYGRSTQETTTGKNLCTSIIGAGTTDLRFLFNKNNFDKTFTLSFTSNETLNVNSIYLDKSVGGTVTVGTISGSANTRVSATATISDSIYTDLLSSTWWNLRVYKNNGNFTIPNDAMIQTGSILSPYEPYTGGISSPNPDFPSEIESVTGEISATVTGKNLFDKDNCISGSYLSNLGQLLGSSTFNITEYIPVIPNAEYTISGITSSGSNPSYCFYDKGKNFISGETHKGYLGEKTITIPANCYYFRDSINNVDIDTYQFEKSTQATSYEEYKSNTSTIDLQGNELCSLPNGTKDEVNITNGEALLIKKIRHITRAIADMNNSDAYPGWTNETQLKEDYPNKNESFLTAGINIRSNITNDAKYIGLNTNASGTLMLFKNLFNNMTQTEIKANYPDLVLDLYYELAEPETINLGTVEMPHTYNGVSNITNSADTEMIVKYYKKFEFDKILRSGYNIDEQEYEIAKKQMANGKRKKILSSYVDCIIKIDLGLLDNKTYQEYKEQLEDGEYEYWSYKYNQYKKANFILTKPSITTEYAYDDDIGIDDMEITLEKSSDVS